MARAGVELYPALLTAEEQQRLETVLTASTELKRCYDLKESFRDWFETAPTRQVAAERLTEWLALVQVSRHTIF